MNNGPITINGTATVHKGNEYGSKCGVGFNRRGRVPQVRKMPAGTAITCKKCSK